MATTAYLVIDAAGRTITEAGELPPIGPADAPASPGTVTVVDYQENIAPGYVTSWSVTFASTPADDDYIVLAVLPDDAGGGSGYITPPAGFSVADQWDPNFRSAYIWTKRASGEASATYTLTSAGSTPLRTIGLVFSGVDTTTALDASIVRSGVQTNAADIPSITTVTDNALLLAIAFRASSGSLGTPTDPLSSGFTTHSATSANGIAVWTGTIATAGATGTYTGTSGFTGSAVGVAIALRPAPGGSSPQTWTGTAGTITVAGDAGSFSPGAITWTGSAATLTVTGDAGSFTAGAIMWTGTDGTVTVTATGDAFTPGTATWSGTAGTVTVTGTDGAFVPGAVTWSGTDGTVTVTGDAGAFSSGSGPQTWTGTDATIAITGTAGSFTAGAVTWSGTSGTVTVTAADGSFVPGAVTWSGTDGTVTVTGSSGSFTAGAATWSGSAGTVTVTGTDGAFSAGAVTWSGTGATVTITATAGDFVGFTVAVVLGPAIEFVEPLAIASTDPDPLAYVGGGVLVFTESEPLAFAERFISWEE